MKRKIYVLGKNPKTVRYLRDNINLGSNVQAVMLKQFIKINRLDNGAVMIISKRLSGIETSDLLNQIKNRIPSEYIYNVDYLIEVVEE